jgi:uncharacterized OB-fold protein
MSVTEITDEEVVAKFPGVYIDHDNKDYWKGKLQKRLLFNRCQDCGYWIYPFRPVCPECWSDKVSAEEVGGKGFIYLLVFYHQGRPIPGVTYSPPYAVAAVELEEREGLRYVALDRGRRQRGHRDRDPGRVDVDRARRRTGTGIPAYRIGEAKRWRVTR